MIAPRCKFAVLILFVIVSAAPLVGHGQSDENSAALPSSGATSTSQSPIELPASIVEAEARRADVIAKASAATIGVFGKSGGGGGSGVLITPDGFALTNFHVVQGNGPFMHCSLPNGALYEAVIVGIDPVGDVALIKLLGRDDFPVAPIGDSDQVKQGQWCFAVGNPFLLATNFQPTVTWGIVSGTNRYQYPAGTLLEYTDCLQTDAAINPGNSGGPLFNDRGDLIGINGRGSFEKRGRINVGVGYAISINQCRLFLSHLYSGRLVDHATLGATVETDSRGNVAVGNILETSDAYRQGLRIGDEILSFAGREITTVNQFKNILGIYPKGFRLPVTFQRNGTPTTIRVRLAGVHATEKLIELIEGEQAAQPNPTPPTPPVTSPNPQTKSVNARFFEARRGFANFYFNRLSRDKVWQKFGEYASGTNDQATFQSDETWNLKGELESGASMEFVLKPNQNGLQLANETFLLDLSDALESQIESQSSQLLLAASLYRRLLTNGPDRYGDVIYFGQLPTPEGNRMAEVLEGVFETTLTRFFFSPETGELWSIEVLPDVEAPPVVVTIRSDTNEPRGYRPSEMVFRFGVEEPMVFKVEGFERGSQQK